MPTSSVVYLPNGQVLTASPVFGGFFFKPIDLNVHNSVFPAGWTVIIQSEDYSDEYPNTAESTKGLSGMPKERRHRIHPYRCPTLHNDNLFISSISNPSSSDFKTPTSPTRQIAMMLWATLYWYFHQPEPSLYLITEASEHTPEEGRPRGEWRINIKREGVFRGRNLIQKLERMGLIASEDSMVGLNPEENTAGGWSEMFTSRRVFWQLSAKLFLFTLSPTMTSSFPGTPFGSRPGSPARVDSIHPLGHKDAEESAPTQVTSPGLWSPSATGPFSSGSHLPTYYPPPPLQYTMTSGVRHPIRQKPPRQGEIFYTRYVTSLGQYLSFRTASLSSQPVAYKGPSAAFRPPRQHHATASSIPYHLAHSSEPTFSEPNLPSQLIDHDDTSRMSDTQLLNKWMNVPRVSKFWDCTGPQETQGKFLETALLSKHSFPVIGLWDGKPFGYFEIYWVKEDILGKHLGNRANNFDRGVHVLVGEQEFRGPHRVKVWIKALAHYAFMHDYRTDSVVLEPRVDNEKFISILNDSGFLKEGEISFPHKQSAFVRLMRENFEAPAL